MKKLISLLAVIMLVSMLAFAVTANEEPYLVVDEIVAAPGEQVVVDVEIKNNPGFAEGVLTITYDSSVLEPVDMIWDDPDDDATWGLQYIRIGAEMNYDENGEYIDKISTWVAMAETNMETGKVAFAASKKMSKDGAFMNMGFKVKDDAKPGVYEVSIYVEYFADDEDFLVGETFTGSVVIPCNEHVAGEVQIENVVAATCQASGSHDEVTYCIYCDAEMSRTTVTDPKLDHTPADAVVENSVDATCQAPGSYDEVVYCSVCGEEISRETKTVAQLEHTPADAVIENSVDATCQAPGSYDEVVYCSVCGEEISRETKTVAQLEHTPADAVVENIVVATCQVVGSYEEVVYCSVCGEEISRTKVETALGEHVPGEAVMENISNADCMTRGSYDLVVYCTVCGEELSRERVDGEYGSHAAGEVVIENVVAGADCQSKGSYEEVVYCTVCGEELSRETKEGEYGEHTWSTVVTPATCCKDGLEVVICDVCNEISKETVLPATGDHTIVYYDNEDGKTHTVYCQTGDEVLNPAEEHTYGDYVEDTENPGWKFKVCDRCGYEHREESGQTGDNSMIAVAVATLSMLSIALVVSKKKEF